MIYRVSLALAAFAMVGAPATAATIVMQTAASASAVGALINDTSTYFGDTITDGPTRQQSALATNGNDTGTAFASADATTGVTRSSVTGSAIPVVFGLQYTPDVNVFSLVRLSEGFTVSGNGSIRIEVDYDGVWDLTPNTFDFTAIGGTAGEYGVQWQAQGTLELGTSSGFARDSFLLNQTTAARTGSAAGTLSVVGQVRDGEIVNVTSSLLTQMLAGTNGSVDFARTAYLSVSFFDGATGVPNDPRFLSIDPRPGEQPAVIPLPASALLLPVSLGLMAALRRRRRAA